MDFKEKILERIKFVSKKEIVGIIVGLIIIILGAIYFFVTTNEVFSEDETFEIEETNMETNNFVQEEIKTVKKVYITGEVNNPGVYEISDDERIEDIILMAGGVTNEADLTQVNLAYKLEDGQKVYIPNINEHFENDILSTENGENVIKGTSKTGKININSANVEKLCELPGVGEAMAQKIIKYREENGKFNKIEDIKNVSGIGEKKYESIKEYIEV